MGVYSYFLSLRKFKFGRLEKWWVAFDRPKQFGPYNRIHLFGDWFWCKSKKGSYDYNLSKF